MASNSAFSPEIMFEDLGINPYDVATTKYDFIQRVVVKVKELKDRVTDTKTMYGNERIRSSRIVRALNSGRYRIPGFPDASTIRKRKEKGGCDEDLVLHKTNFENLKKIHRFIEIIHDSEVQHENGGCKQKMEDKSIKMRSILFEMKSFLDNNGLSMDDTDSDKTDGGCIYNELESMDDRSDRFHRDYLILRETENYCDDMISVYTDPTMGGVDE